MMLSHDSYIHPEPVLGPQLLAKNNSLYRVKTRGLASGVNATRIVKIVRSRLLGRLLAGWWCIASLRSVFASQDTFTGQWR